MLVPSIFGESLFDDMFDFPWDRDFYTNSGWTGSRNLMKTDVKETDQTYELDIDLPGVKTDDIKIQLKDGYLTVSASKNVGNDEKKENGSYIRRERYSGSCSRSFYVGENVKQEDVHAKYENGILKLSVPKTEQKQVAQNNKYIAIEG